MALTNIIFALDAQASVGSSRCAATRIVLVEFCSFREAATFDALT